MTRCPVCRGSRKINLPLYPELVASFIEQGEIRPDDLHETSREYGCPECSPGVSPDKVAVLEYRAQMTHREEYAGDPGYKEHMFRHALHSLVDAAAAHAVWEEGPILRDASGYGEVREHRLRLGVVSQGAVKTIEERVAENQMAVAQEVVGKAIGLIDIWGRDYGWASISKDSARRFIHEAMAFVASKRRVP